MKSGSGTAGTGSARNEWETKAANGNDRWTDGSNFRRSLHCASFNPIQRIALSPQQIPLTPYSQTRRQSPPKNTKRKES